MSQFTGNCLCGQVSYKAEGEPMFQANCHCTDCRKATGASFATLVFLKEDHVTISGELKSFEHSAASGNQMIKQFCPICGSQMFSISESRAGWIGLRAGQIREVENINPQFNVYAGSRLPCTVLDDNLTAFEKMPN